MISGMVNSYVGFVNSKKVYLRRKKLLNKEIKIIKKRKLACKPYIRIYYDEIIEKGNDDLDLLKIMYKYHKRKNTRKRKRSVTS